MKKGKTTSEKPSKAKSILSMDVSFGTTSLEARAAFAKNMAVMLRSGLTINQALAIAAEQNRGKFRRILQKVLASVESGNSLADSMADYPGVFSNLFVKVVYVGEQSGRLDENLETMARQLEKEKELRSKIQGAMIYPVVIMIATIVMGLAIAFLVLPKIVPLLRSLNVDLPWTTRVLISFADLVANNGLQLFAGSMIGLILLIWILRRKFMHPFTHWVLIHLPVIGPLIRNANLARFSRTLGLLLQSGLNIDDALNIAKETVTNFYYKNALTRIAVQVGQGVELSTSLERFKSLFPILLIRMVAVGEKSGKIEELLFYLADFYDIEVDTATKTFSTALEPFLLLLIGLLVGGLALAIITPIYQVTGNISNG